MKIVDLKPHHTGRMRQAALLLHRGFKEHWPDAWPTGAAALEEVDSMLGDERIALVALDARNKVLGWIGGIRQYEGHAWAGPMVPANPVRRVLEIPRGHADPSRDSTPGPRSEFLPAFGLSRSVVDSIGPRGEKTTVSKRGLIRKTIWIHEDENEALRRAAFEERKTETEIVRELLRRRFELSD